MMRTRALRFVRCLGYPAVQCQLLVSGCRLCTRKYWSILVYVFFGCASSYIAAYGQRRRNSDSQLWNVVGAPAMAPSESFPVQEADTSEATPSSPQLQTEVASKETYPD